ncbi:MAG: maleylpyruvate isomerase family mycothiol-dependent enzyme [Caldilineaceae bacterium]|nr:maleylpyruvate isomerase family mycothiol-dependent enzyme [Caldilineaceae bacterium]
MQQVQPILTAHLFPELHEALMALLRDLSPGEWQQPTACTGWTVRDVAAHLLGDDIGKLSAARDGHRAGWFAVDSWEELVAAINGANEQWVRALKRMSPQLLCEFLDSTGQQVTAFFATLDPHAMGGPVDWAGSDPAPVWLDLAREYTERWHHQQHIRDAVGKPGMTEPRYLHPILDTFLRALPHTFRNISAPPETVVQIAITGTAGGDWFLQRDAQAWHLCTAVDREPTTTVALDEERAWRLLTHGLGSAEARQNATIVGDVALGEHFFQAVSIIA